MTPYLQSVFDALGDQSFTTLGEGTNRRLTSFLHIGWGESLIYLVDVR
jgi:hypothetical protein